MGETSLAAFRRVRVGDSARTLRRVLVEGGVASLAYAMVAVLITWPLATRMGSSIIGVPGDPASDVGGTVAWLWSLPQEGGYHIFGATKHTLTGAPLGWDQGNAINIQWLPTYYPAYLASLVVGEVAAYNLTVLSGLVLSALAMYALVRRLGCTPLVAGWAGLAFMIFPWHIWRVNVGHASLVHLEVLPLLIIALHAWTQRPTPRRAALVGLATTAAWLFSGYWGAMAVIGAVAFALAAGALQARGDGIRRAGLRALTLTTAVLLGSLAVALLSLPGRTEGGITTERTVSYLAAFAARPADYLAPAADNPILDSVGARLQPGLHGSNPGEATLYLGWLTIALAAFWLLTVLRRRRVLPRTLVATTAGLIATLLAGLAFAAPSPITIHARSFVPTPSWILFHVLPEIRVPSRFVALVATALFPIAALGLQFVSDRIRDRGKTPRSGRRLAIGVGMAALLISTVELFPSFADETRADRLPDPYQAIERTPPGVLAEYPMGELNDEKYKFWQRLHGRRLMNGTRAGTSAGDLARGLSYPGTAGTAEALALLGVNAIVTRYKDGTPEALAADRRKGYEVVHASAAGIVRRVVARPAPAVAFLAGSAFTESLWPREGVIWYPMQQHEGTMELRGKTPGRVRLFFETNAPDGTARTLRVTGASGAVTVPLVGRKPVSLVVVVPRGRSRLKLTVDPSSPGHAPGVEISAPRASRTVGRPALRAELVSPDPGF